MKEKIKQLLEVQEIDLRIMSLSQEKEALPQELKEFDEVVKNEEVKKKILEEESHSLVKERRQKERELEGQNEMRKKFQGQLYQLKSNKEYSALLHEIEAVKKEIERLEEEILVLMEEIEDKEKKFAEENKILDVKRKELEEASKISKEKFTQLNARLGEEEKHRKEKSAHIPRDLLNPYERVRQARNGIGIAAIRNDACQGCFMELPPQVISETKLGHRVVTCENCNRLLYIDNETSIA